MAYSSLTGTQSQVPLRGINGGGIPWTVADASGELRANGHLKIHVEGLVLAAGGNAEIEADIALPQPCIAPIIFVASGTSGAWFAATGF